MYKITIKIDGMMCGMCESHINDAVRRELNVKKVSSSHTKGQTVITSDRDISDEDIHKAIDPTGYEVISINREEASEAENEKKGLFSKLFKK